jgi:hypothetical protein
MCSRTECGILMTNAFGFVNLGKNSSTNEEVIQFFKDC